MRPRPFLWSACIASLAFGGFRRLLLRISFDDFDGLRQLQNGAETVMVAPCFFLRPSLRTGPGSQRMLGSAVSTSDYVFLHTNR